MRKKTHEEYVEELKVKNPTVEVVGKYIDAKTKIMHYCLIHDIYWNTSPSSVLQGCGCELCRRNKLRIFHNKTHEEYVLNLKKVNPDIIALEEYKGSHVPILHKCLKHDIKWKTSPTNALQGHGCCECRSEKIKNKTAKTHEEYVLELRNKNPDIIVIEEYKGANVPILHKCKIDGYEWMVRPGNILFGKGCPVCGGKIKLTTQEYNDRLKILNTNIKPLEDYINARTPILHECLICGHRWKASPTNVLKGQNCPECRNNMLRKIMLKDDSQYRYELMCVNPDVVPMEPYKGANVPILHKCLRDGCEWKSAPSNLLWGKGCPMCNESSGERKVRQYLEKHSISYKFQKTYDDCRDIRCLPFDFYLPDYNTCIEYQGKQHYEPIDLFGGEEQFKTQYKHDKIKRDYCKNNNIRLLEIPYWENVEEILNNFLFI